MTIFLVNKFGPVCRDDKQGLFLSHLKLTLFLILLITKENRFSGLKISHSINYPPDNIKAPRSQINRILVEGTQSGTESIESIETNPNIDRVIFGPLRKKHYLCNRNRGVKRYGKERLGGLDRICEEDAVDEAFLHRSTDSIQDISGKDEG
jgi:hypothetical protein